MNESSPEPPLSVADFLYELPQEAIAQRPAPEREQARLLMMEGAGAELTHHRYADLPALARGDELFVLNDTRVVPARLRARKETGGRVELLIMGPDPERSGAMLALGRASKGLREGTTLTLEDQSELTILGKGEGGVVSVSWPQGEGEDRWALLERLGELPLPPYIERPHGPSDEDKRRYQSVFATHSGSSAAPTASLHFTSELLGGLEARGCETTRVTLHVGPGTFQPVRTETLSEHVMHRERYEVSEEAAQRIACAREAGRPVVAVGTTVVRTLESLMEARGELVAHQGSTALFIQPGYRFQVVDQLLTNFHLPGSTLLMLVSALAGRARVMEAYATALRSGYRFFSYGDGMWIR